ncbi:lycopene beta-cyclase CrtY [Novosphingobium sp. Rr 2-17]|uniref:lycopene beta-cyclase CrtY n=1 Tax=Novosphingobium sp. Rr 2-17 TaxID=555793 RepID=UPI00030BD14E|nr:lycopene beta-cyclase CrtY [Novosphingobium sp. Rr 2-17]
MPNATDTCDLAILGGGLAGAFIALAFAQHKPALDVRIVERGERLGGHHVWSFFASDLSVDGAALLDPMVAAAWDGYDVHFPGRSRQLANAYRSITSEHLDAAIRDALPAHRVLRGMEVTAATPTSVTLGDGRTLHAGAVIDARGPSGLPHMAGGWQKFLGRTLRITGGHGLERPIIMDATVEQLDGYRFVYCLPFSADEVFVEDTYYADTPDLDIETLRARIAAYAHDRGWQVEAVTYEETGVLPVIAAGDFAAFWRAGGDLSRAGARAALVHPLTSYSIPDAVSFALHLSSLDNLGGESLGKVCHDWAAQHWRKGRFYRMLSRMLFGAAEPAERWRMLARFYTLPEALIERFYAGRSTATDRLRILAGKPPVPVSAAIASLAGRGRPLADLA